MRGRPGTSRPLVRLAVPSGWGACLLLLLLCAGGLTAAVQTGSIRSLSREAAVDIALQQSPQLLEARAREERAEGASLRASAPLYPRLTATGSYEDRDPGLRDTNDRDGDENAEEPTPDDADTDVTSQSARVQGEIRQTLFDGLRSVYRHRAGRKEVEAERLRLRQVERNVAEAVRTAYDEALLAARTVEFRAERHARLRELEAMVGERVAGGTAMDYQLQQARIERQRAEVDLRRADVRAREARLALLDAIGWEGEEPPEFSLSDPLEPVVEDVPPRLDPSRLAAAYPEIESFRASAEAARFEATAARLGAIPSLEAYANYQYKTSYYDFDDRLHGWAAGVVVQWNLFDGFARRGAVREALADRRLYEDRARTTEGQVRRALRLARERLRRSLEALAAEESSLRLAERSSNQARILFEEGRVSLEQVLRTELSLEEARNRRAEAVQRLNAAYYRYQSLAGFAPRHS